MAAGAWLATLINRRRKAMGVYFGQDFIEDYGGGESALTVMVAGNVGYEVAMLAELDALLAQRYSESELSELLHQTSFYAVEDDGLTYPQWRRLVRAAFAAALEAKPAP